MADRSVNVIAMVKEEERYVFLYDDSSIDQVLEQMGKYAADEELSFTWYDAALLSQRLKDEVARNATAQ